MTLSAQPRLSLHLIVLATLLVLAALVTVFMQVGLLALGLLGLVLTVAFFALLLTFMGGN